SLGKGRIENVEVGQAGKLLRIVSFDSLLLNFQLDFRDNFSDNFEYDYIKVDLTVKQVVLNAKSVALDGVIADISIK
ncbi:AsmA-like C-terminal region-containing protein, partial [Proteus mirabilis]|uniref:YhdP family protein n=1 Tax=Proteus mirabilis TaxID=584 RepID=UPI00391951A1